VFSSTMVIAYMSYILEISLLTVVNANIVVRSLGRKSVPLRYVDIGTRES